MSLIQSSEPETNKTQLNDLVRRILGATLLICRKKDISDNDKYNQYDGTYLPPASGFNIDHAMVTYMSTGGRFTNHINKIRAIELYIETQILATPEKVERFCESSSTWKRNNYTN